MRASLPAPLLALSLLACAPRPCPPPVLHVSGPPRPFLYEVRGARATLHLLGTFHAGGRADVPAEAWRRLDSARTLVLEVDAKSVDADTLRRWKTIPFGEKTLDQLLPSDAWWRLVDRLQGLVREDVLRRARPWWAMALLTAAIVRPPSPGMDEALRARAEERGLHLEFLEGYAEQMEAIDRSVGVPDLLRAIDDIDVMRCRFAALAAAYRAGDAEAMRGLLGADQEAALLTARNRRWLERLAPLLDGEGDVFVAVGVSHLVGEGSLPSMLEARGLRVTRL